MHAFVMISMALIAICTAEGIDSDMYLSDMCWPLFSNISRIVDLHLTEKDLIPTLVNSPFPCEQALYIARVCLSNGTTEIDYLAEQQCFCDGGFWEACRGCDNCYIAHGLIEHGKNRSEKMALDASIRTSLSSAECTRTPPNKPFSDLFPPLNFSKIFGYSPPTLTSDLFPNLTEVSDYFTPTVLLTPGAITGNATARNTGLPKYGAAHETHTTQKAGESKSEGVFQVQETRGFKLIVVVFLCFVLVI
ncbi:uncharacterized protein N7483_011083 [Penicillium malachiteum]|uniref:uncharacterized protein n=1 Tax=Penicillium malachiteum TaxID=1324776 RepID=UPI0025495F3A|nr:uncharacterized protein N7483_011083 [Penicillium malachiteum]KAJ5713902.1 hypothetical protein N7483_011083 [Penicillium malachiteum]